MAEPRVTSSAILHDGGFSVVEKVSNGVTVKVRVPKEVPEATRRRKINRIYDLLNPVASQ